MKNTKKGKLYIMGRTRPYYIGFYVDDEVKDKLKQISQEKGKTVSDIMRDLVKEFITKETKEK